MGLRKRNGTWHYQFEIDGVTYSASTDLADVERNRNGAHLAEAKARELVAKGRASELRTERKPFDLAAREFIEWCKGEYRDRPRTWKRYDASTTSLKAFFGSIMVHAITPGRIEDYKSYRRRQNIAEVTLRHDLHVLGPLLSYARKHNWLSHDPLEPVDIPSDAESCRMHIVTPAEELVYFEAMPHVNRELHDLTRLMLLQGPRPWCEVAAARVEHINLERGEWFIPRSKSKASKRTLYLVPEAREILARLVAEAGTDGRLFHLNADGGWLKKVHRGVVKDLGLPPEFVIYDFRHTFATRMAQSGCDIATLARILGHADLHTVQKYIHIQEDHIRQAMVRYGSQAGVATAAASVAASVN